MDELNELITTITSTEMPDGKYPVFRLLKIKDKCHAQFAWRHIEITTIGFNEEDIIFEAAVIFTVAVESFLDEILSKGGSS